jgi:hypothetical protein
VAAVLPADAEARLNAAVVLDAGAAIAVEPDGTPCDSCGDAPATLRRPHAFVCGDCQEKLHGERRSPFNAGLGEHIGAVVALSSRRHSEWLAEVESQVGPIAEAEG